MVGRFWRQLLEWRGRKRFRARDGRRDGLPTWREATKGLPGLGALGTGRPAGRAKLDFGNLSLVREDSRAPWVFAAWDALQQDLRFGARWLTRNPLLTLAVVTTLSLGVGANAAVFSVVRALLFDVPGVTEPSDLLFLGDSDSAGMRVNPNQRSSTLFSFPFFTSLRQQATFVSGLAAQSSFPNRVFWRPEGGDLRRLQGRLVSGNYFQVLGVGAAQGRLLTPEDDRTSEVRPVAGGEPRFLEEGPRRATGRGGKLPARQRPGAHRGGSRGGDLSRLGGPAAARIFGCP